MARRFAETAFVLLLVLASASGRATEPFVVDPLPPTDRPPLVLSFVGDIMHHERNAGMPDYDRLYDEVRPLLAVDDLSFANIEFPVDPSQEPAGYPLFNGSRAYLEAAVRGGFDVLALANNHTFDLGEPGVRGTSAVVADLAATAGVRASGIRAETNGPIALTRIHHRGWLVGFVSVTSFSNVPGSSRHINLVDYSDPGPRAAFVGQVRRWSEEVDLLVVAIHAGVEYSTVPAAHKVDFFRDVSDAGAHIVWGHHPHVLQPWELRDGRLVVYSSGNFVSAQRRYQSPYVPTGRWAPTGDTAVYQVRVERDATAARVTQVRTPLYTMVDDPRHGLVLRSFDRVLARELPVVWRAFYLARYSAGRRLVDAPPPVEGGLTARRARGSYSTPAR